MLQIKEISIHYLFELDYYLTCKFIGASRSKSSEKIKESHSRKFKLINESEHRQASMISKVFFSSDHPTLPLLNLVCLKSQFLI